MPQLIVWIIVILSASALGFIVWAVALWASTMRAVRAAARSQKLICDGTLRDRLEAELRSPFIPGQRDA